MPNMALPIEIIKLEASTKSYYLVQIVYFMDGNYRQIGKHESFEGKTNRLKLQRQSSNYYGAKLTLYQILLS